MKTGTARQPDLESQNPTPESFLEGIHAIFNSRGVYFPDAEGRAERELAEIYRRKADETELAGYYRLANTLRGVAESYDRQAKQNPSRMLLED